MLLRGFAQPRGVGCRRRILTAQRINSAVRKAEQHHWVCINGNTMHLTRGTSCLCLQGFKPKLTIEQQEDLAQVFKLMDGELGMCHALMRTATTPEGPSGGSGCIACWHCSMFKRLLFLAAIRVRRGWLRRNRR